MTRSWLESTPGLIWSARLFSQILAALQLWLATPPTSSLVGQLFSLACALSSDLSCVCVCVLLWIYARLMHARAGQMSKHHKFCNDLFVQSRRQQDCSAHTRLLVEMVRVFFSRCGVFFFVGFLAGNMLSRYLDFNDFLVNLGPGVILTSPPVFYYLRHYFKDSVSVTWSNLKFFYSF